MKARALKALIEAWFLHLRHRWTLAWVLVAAMVVGWGLDGWVTRLGGDPGAQHAPRTSLPQQPLAIKLEGIPDDLAQRLMAHGLQAEEPTRPSPWHLSLELSDSHPEGRLRLSSPQGHVPMQVQRRVQAAVDAAETERMKAWAQAQGFSEGPPLWVETANASRTLDSPLADLAFRIALLVMSALALALFIGGSLGLDWDVQRNASNLESWSTSLLPIWVLYGSQALARATLVGLALTALGLTLLLGGGRPWGLSVGVLAYVATMGFAFSLAVSMWSLFATMLFHHRYGRMFSRMLLSPLGMLFTLWLVGFGLGFPGRSFSQDRTQIMALLESQADLLPALLAALALLAPLGAIGAALALVPLIEWRIGVRRRGLRKL